MTIAKVGIGAVVPTGTPKPPLRQRRGLKAALLGAKTIVYAFPAGGGAAGVHIAKVIDAARHRRAGQAEDAVRRGRRRHRGDAWRKGRARSA